MSRCRHGYCLQCNDICPICGFDEEKYNLGPPIKTCKVKSVDNPKPKNFHRQKCNKCGKSVAEMTCIEKDQFFMLGFCC